MKDNQIKIINDDLKNQSDSFLEKEWYQIPATNVDYLFRFKYKLFAWSTTFVMLLTVFLLPMTLTLIFRYGNFTKDTLNKSKNILRYVKFMLGLFGFGYTLAREKKRFITSGAWAIYLYLMMWPIISIILAIPVGIFPELIQKDHLGEIFLTASGKIVAFLIQIIVALLIITLILLKSPELRKKILMTFKENYLLLMVVLIFALLVFYELIARFDIIDGLINPKKETSINQSSLESIASSTTGKIVLFFGTVLIIPFLEELATRHSFFALSNNRWLGLVFSTLYFAYMHVDNGGDFNKIFSYFPGGLSFSLIFVISRENILYPTILHTVTNLIAYIFIVR